MCGTEKIGEKWFYIRAPVLIVNPVETGADGSQFFDILMGVPTLMGEADDQEAPL